MLEESYKRIVNDIKVLGQRNEEDVKYILNLLKKNKAKILEENNKMKIKDSPMILNELVNTLLRNELESIIFIEQYDNNNQDNCTYHNQDKLLSIFNKYFKIEDIVENLEDEYVKGDRSSLLSKIKINQINIDLIMREILKKNNFEILDKNKPISINDLEKKCISKSKRFCFHPTACPTTYNISAIKSLLFYYDEEITIWVKGI